jgi:hypothetical protein
MRHGNPIPALLLLSLLASGLAGQNNVRVTSRIQMGYENDTNVQEQLRDSRAAENTRLLFDFKVDNRNWTASYQGGCQLYSGFSQENKMAHELTAAVRRPLARHLHVGLQTWGRFKHFLKADRDMVFGFLQPYVLMSLDDRTSVQVGLRQEVMDYKQSDYFDYTGYGGNVQVRRKISSGWSLSPLFSWQRDFFLRQAHASYTNMTALLSLAEKQRDDITAAGLQSEWLWRSLLVTFLYKYEINRSNSYGYSYDRHVFSAIFAQQWQKWFFRGCFTWQKKNYQDDLLPYLPIELDTEQEENNFIVLDLSRDLFDGLCVVGRLAWYQNESPWANLYYRKTLTQLFLEWRF